MKPALVPLPLQLAGVRATSAGKGVLLPCDHSCIEQTMEATEARLFHLEKDCILLTEVAIRAIASAECDALLEERMAPFTKRSHYKVHLARRLHRLDSPAEAPLASQ